MNIIDEMAIAAAEVDSGPVGSGLFTIHWSEFGPGYIASARASLQVLRDKGMLNEIGIAAVKQAGPPTTDHKDRGTR